MKQFSSLHHYVAISFICGLTWLPLSKEGATAGEQIQQQPAAASGMVKRFIKIYPDPSKKAMYVEAKQAHGLKIDFFVFDLEGTLMKHFKMKTGDREKISGLEKGKYVYSVFSGDEEADHGEFDIH
ncbi:MAG TPA: T9SS type A sorting domain-containing protein [Chitinophagaceae bacterium]|nr:T9SS type A sorting domain-containing protein [Chitinophagaceae bacterium]